MSQVQPRVRTSDEPADPLVRTQLVRILSNELFSRSDRLSAFLKFIVEETLNGQGDTLKEQVIATKVYGKGADFNTAADPIVRVEGSSVGTASWSPDGRFLVFDVVDGKNVNDLYVVSADGGPLRRLTNNHEREVNPEWSRDGRWIYYASDASGRLEIWKIPAAGGMPVQLTMDGGGVEPRESPDGRSVYFLEPPRLHRSE
jgi:Tol biopolymer transport system component